MAKIISFADFKNRLFSKEEQGFFENLFYKGQQAGLYATLEESCKTGCHRLTIVSVLLTDELWDDRPKEQCFLVKRHFGDGSISYEYFDGKMEVDVAQENDYAEPRILSAEFHVMIPYIIKAQQAFSVYLQQRLDKKNTEKNIGSG